MGGLLTFTWIIDGTTDLPGRFGFSFEYVVCASKSHANAFNMGNNTKY